MTDVVVCGPASWNHLVRLESLPAPVPHMEVALGDHETLGGTSAGKALHLRDLGRPLLLHTVLGDDEHAARIEAALERAEVPVDVARVTGPSERHLNLMDRDGGRVSLYLSLMTGADRPPGPELVATMAGARAVVLDLAARSLEVLPVVRELGVPVWTDVHDYDGTADFHRPFLDVASHVFMNGDKLPDPVAFLHSLVARGARLAVCTLGADGAVAVDADGTEHRVPAEPVAKVVDTNGAGDAFMAGCLHATLDGAPVPAALRAGAVQATRALASAHLSPLLDAER